MAKKIKLCYAATIFCFLILCQSSTARPFNGFYPNNLHAMEPELNLALPGNEISASPDPAHHSDTESQQQHVLPCEMDFNKMEIPAAKRLVGKYGPLLLHMLPKGIAVPPSGPSKRINGINN